MPFDKNTAQQAGKKSSRKGSPNRFTADIRQTLKNVLADELEQLPDILAELPPEKRVDVLVKLAQFVLPKVVTVSPGDGEPINFDPYAVALPDGWK